MSSHELMNSAKSRTVCSHKRRHKMSRSPCHMRDLPRRVSEPPAARKRRVVIVVMTGQRVEKSASPVGKVQMQCRWTGSRTIASIVQGRPRGIGQRGAKRLAGRGRGQDRTSLGRDEREEERSAGAKCTYIIRHGGERQLDRRGKKRWVEYVPPYGLPKASAVN